MSQWIWTVDIDPRGERIDKCLALALEKGRGEFMPGPAQPLTRSRLQGLIEEGCIRVGDRVADSRTKLATGQTVTIKLPAPAPLELQPEDRPLEILFQDEHLAVINKPAGLTVHPSSTQLEGTLVHILLHHLKDLSGIGGVMRPGIVHRLDKDTSGALVVTKTDAAHLALTEIFAKHDLERRYWALVYGEPRQVGKNETTVRSTIGRNPNDRVRMAMDVKGGKEAITHLRHLESYGQNGKNFASLIEARLETGRTHQVRVHLTGLGSSLLGDPLYGTPTSQAPKWKALPVAVREAVEKLPGQALHARVLGFKHPVTGATLRFEAEPPTAFRAVQAALAAYK